MQNWEIHPMLDAGKSYQYRVVAPQNMQDLTLVVLGSGDVELIHLDLSVSATEGPVVGRYHGAGAYPIEPAKGFYEARAGEDFTGSVLMLRNAGPRRQLMQVL